MRCASYFTTLAYATMLVAEEGDVIKYCPLSTEKLPERGVVRRCIMIGIPVIATLPFIFSIFGSTLEVESESNPANLLSYLTICLAVAITPHFFMRGVADNVLSEALAAN